MLEGKHTQARCLREWRPSLSVISAAFMAFCRRKGQSHAPKLMRPQGVPREGKGDGGVTYGQILLVGEDQENGIPQLVLVEHALELLTGLDDTVAIVAVDDEDDTLGVLEVMSPQRTNLVLATDIPHGELNVLVLDSLDVET